jgi:ferric-dicitrate binding protein FerR (iron transport regulator)
MTHLERLGRAVAAAQDRALARSDLGRKVRLSRRVPQGLSAGVRSRALRWWARSMALTARSVAVAAMLGLGMLVAVAWLRHEDGAAPEPLRFSLGSQVVLDGQRWVTAPKERSVSLQFSDGSKLVLAPQSNLFVERLEPAGAVVRLEQGSAHLTVRHGQKTLWTVHAGPFTTRVIGTQFDVAWAPTLSNFRLDMLQGAVELNGPLIGPRRVVAGETVSVALGERRAQVTQRDADANVAVNADASAVEPASAPTTPIASQRARARAPGKPKSLGTPRLDLAPAADFEALYGSGRYAEAVAAVVRVGWEQALHASSSAALLRLAGAARLSKQVDRAEQVYAKVRARFAHSDAAARAAFELGRLSQDQRRQPAAAASWFEAYLHEAPNGSFVQEAEGRLLEVYVSMVQLDKARSLAQHYRQTFPSGPYRPLVERLLGPSP